MMGFLSRPALRVDYGLLLVALLSAAAKPAAAFQTGITGRSGKQGATCNELRGCP